MEHFNPGQSPRPSILTPRGLDGRGGPRLSVELEAVLSGSRVGRKTVNLQDLSSSGCRIDCVSNYPVGTHVIITIPGLSPIGAQVRWCDLDSCGLQFNRPMHSSVIDRIAGKAYGQS